MEKFCAMLEEFFKTKTKNGSAHARHYLAGLLSRTQRKNMERFSEGIPEADYQGLQQFLSDSPWAFAPLWSWTRREAARLLGEKGRPHLLIDESAFAKKGDKSAGVARQYNGRLGKVDNSQVGVFAALARDQRAVLTGARLYLPKDWVNDPKRCRAAGIPKEQQVFRTKAELAWELIEEAIRDGIEFATVGIDAGYGRDQAFLLKISGAGKIFVADVDHDQLVWLHEPVGHRRPASLAEAGAEPVDGLRKVGPVHLHTLRIAENGPVQVKFSAQRVWIWPTTGPLPMEVWLLISRRSDGSVKYSLCNAGEEMGWAELANLQGQRYFIERAFEDGKSELGLGDYQVRKWLGWQHHMALVGAAMVFALKERCRHAAESPLLSVRDVVEMVAWYFTKEPTTEELTASIRDRHQRRKQAMESKLRRHVSRHYVF